MVMNIVIYSFLQLIQLFTINCLVRLQSFVINIQQYLDNNCQQYIP